MSDKQYYKADISYVLRYYNVQVTYNGTNTGLIQYICTDCFKIDITNSYTVEPYIFSIQMIKSILVDVYINLLGNRVIQ